MINSNFQKRKVIIGILTTVSMFLILSFSKLQNYGLNKAEPIAPYLNGKLSVSNSTWNAVPAFPDLLLDFPIYIKQVPGHDLFIVTLKEGEIYLIDNTEQSPSKKLLIDFRQYVNKASDAGLFDIVFHPEFDKDGSKNRRYIYVNYNYVPERLDNDPIRYLLSYNRVSRFTLSEDFKSINPESELVIIQHFDRHVWHTGGAMFFDKYGFLNISFGDEGGAGDEFDNSQLINKRLFGGVLRIDVDMDSTRSHPIRRYPKPPVNVPEGWPDDIYENYFIPDDNPWVSETEDWLEEFYIIGLRSPHTMFYDSLKDEIWVADVGQGLREEISVYSKGGNGQWPYKEGIEEGPKERPDTVYGTEVEPLYDYGREVGAVVIGGFIYNGALFPELQGKYIFGDYAKQDVWALNPVNGEIEFIINTANAEGNMGFASFGTDVEGNIYLTQLFSPTTNSGTILKLELDKESVPEAPQKLSQLGAFKDLNSLEPIDGFIPYDLNAKLYSDGAAKKRWVAIPNDGNHDSPNEQVRIKDTGEMIFPPGTVLIKHFELNIDEIDESKIQRIETRFLVVKEDGGVYGLTYKWNDEETDAILLKSSDEKDFVIKTKEGTRVQRWNFPSQGQCLSCHTVNAGGVLGPKSYSLNKEIEYPKSGIIDNQLRSWNHINIFKTNVSDRQIDYIPRTASLFDTEASNELKVRSYIDANCSFCHRPNGVEVDFDARFSTHLKNQQIINAAVVSRNSTMNASVITPKDTLHSEMFRRATEEGPLKMPPLGREIVDKEFVNVLRDWIMEMDEELPSFDRSIAFPNPLVGERLKIFLSDQMISDQEISLKIFSETGRLVYEKSDLFLSLIDLKLDLTSGVYQVVLSNRNHCESIKIIKN